MINNNLDVISKKRIVFFLIITMIFFIVIMIKLGSMQLFNTKASLIDLNNKTTKIVYENAKPRGRIYDRNLNIIVDNVGIYTLYYKKENNTLLKDEIEFSYLLADNIEIDYSNLNEIELKKFWIINNEKKANKKITKKEYELFKRRKLSAKKLDKMKLDRITKKELEKVDERFKKASYIYYLMHNGYYYDQKLIKEELSEEEYTFINNNIKKLKGFSVESNWKRIYPYDDTLRQILGNVSNSKKGIPSELLDKYNDDEYSLNDRVGISYLEYQYEKYLRGTKDKYEIKNGKKKLLKKGRKGKDIVLSIDINLQKELENVITEELISAKKEANTNFYDHTSVVITNPKTGEILAMASKQIINTTTGYKVNDYTTSILTLSDVPGSIVKGASMLVGYKTGKLNIGDVYYDKCIKFKNTPMKCSWSSSLGSLNDISALTYSSNSYQFQLALKVAGINYYYDMPIKINEDAINIYKETFNELGLGSKSEIDLPGETDGFKSKDVNAGLYLNYAIGQLDTYSPLQLSSYVNTIINNGKRYKLNLVSEIRKQTNDSSIGDLYKKYEPKLLNTVDIDEKYFERVKLGFKSVLEGPLGYGYMGDINSPAGKTGTSESFYDSDNDGKVDTETYNKSFIGYAPYDDPKMSIVSISPYASYKNSNYSYTTSVNKRIVSRICNIFFEIYK